MRWNTVMLWEVVLITSAIAAAADKMPPERGLNDTGFTFNKKEYLPEEEILFNSTTKREPYQVTEQSRNRNEVLWRDDARCGPNYPLPDGRPAQCKPHSRYGCCSPYGWCGHTPRYCTCSRCIDYRVLWRDDGRCGPNNPLPDGRPAQCKPHSRNSCCSPYGWCGHTPRYCTCSRCIDYRGIETVSKFAPKLRFDSKQGQKNKCFPSSASDYYNARATGDKSRICNTNYNTITFGHVPTYWKAMKCGVNLHINYWFFYGYQNSCFWFFGAHDADWERIMVKVENYKTNDRKLGAVMFYQHNGWYTRKPGSYETDGTHPIVYVGKNSRGSYHDAGGSGGCTYWADYRKPGSPNRYMKTWLNLEELRDNDASAPIFMKDKNSGSNFDGIPSPLQRPEINHLCTQKGCNGHCSTIFEKTCGCDRSQIGDHKNF